MKIMSWRGKKHLRAELNRKQMRNEGLVEHMKDNGRDEMSQRK